MRNYSKTILLAFGFLCSNFANADTVTYQVDQKVQVEQGFDPRSKWITVNLPKFDSKIGKLTSLTFSSFANYNLNVNVDLRSATGGVLFAYGTLNSQAGLFGYNSVVGEFPISGLYTLPSDIVVPSESITAGSTWSAHLSGSWSASETLSSPIAMSYLNDAAVESYYIQYYGAFEYAFESFLWGFNGPYTLDVNGDVNYKYFVTYSYNRAVPEASVWIMLIAGVAGVGVSLRRRRRSREVAGVCLT